MKKRAMYNSSHTALSGGSGRIEDACGESPAASYFGYVRWVKFKLFVHYSFIIRSLVVLLHALCKRSHPKDMLRYLGVTLGSLGAGFGVSWEHLGGS